MDSEARIVLSDRLMLSEVAGSPVGVIRGETSMHFFEGSAADVISDLRRGGGTLSDLSLLQQQRYPDQNPSDLMIDLVTFLGDARDKGLIYVS